jgi:hypothetical protein
MKRSALLSIAGLVVAASAAIPTSLAFAADEPTYCNLATPAVRDVVQDAPAIAAVLNLDPALPNETIEANRSAIGCGPVPAQTPEQARAAVCDVLVEAKLDVLVKETNNPQVTTLVETLRPSIPQLLAQARVQLKCDAAVKDPSTEGKDNAPSATPAPQVKDAPKGGVKTGWNG